MKINRLRSFFTVFLGLFVVTVKAGDYEVIDRLKQWTTKNDITLDRVEFLMDGGSISYHFNVVEDGNIWVLAKNRTSPSNKNKAQSILVADNENYISPVSVPPKSQIESNILDIVAKAKTHLPSKCTEIHMLDDLQELIKYRDRPWPGNSPEKKSNK